jgi:uncharacterized sulfatase
LLPTCLSVAGLTPPTDRVIDGESIKELLTSPEAESPERALFFYHIGELEGVRVGKWKYIRNISHYTWPMPINKVWGKISEHTQVQMPLLFNLESDPDESYNLINKYPDVGREMADIINQWEKDLEANPLGLTQ